MNTSTKQGWSITRKFGILFFSVFFFLQIIQMFSRFFLGNQNMDVIYYPSLFVQNYILRLHAIPKWTHLSSGGADTLDDWVQQLAYILIAIIVAILVIAFSRKRKDYSSLYEWTKISVRYFLGAVMLLYGLNKLFFNQMVYPLLSYFYTPLGDFKPMDLAWTFVGYSPAYQFIGGLLEVIAAVLIFFRRTLVLGLLIFLGVMSNVLMLNYLYGVAVKSWSTTLVIIGLFLLWEHLPKLMDFLLFQKSAKIEVPALNIDTPWKKRARLILKYGYIALVLFILVDSNYKIHSRVNSYNPIPIEGAYDVHSFIVNSTENTDFFNENRWNQVVVNKSPDGLTSSGHVMLGTIKRELATFKIDSLNQLSITFDRDSSMVFKGLHRLSGDSFIWTGTIGKDTIRMVLRKNERELTLHESPFRLIVEPGEQENLRTRK